MSEKIKVERNGEVYYVYETALVKRFNEIKAFVKQHIEEFDRLNGTHYSDNF